jgi:C-terminal processing protease CtpA/Prc
MKASQHAFPALRHAVRGAIVAAAMLPAAALAGEDPNAQVERQLREIEERRQMELSRDEMEQRERTQRQALRGQEQSIGRLEDRLAEAQRRLEQSSREVAQLSGELGRNFSFGQSLGTTIVNAPPRALLGISVDTAERRDGALVSQVSPGGAAAEAGIRSGDLITSLAGQDLTKESNPGRALVEKLQQIKPDTKVQVSVLRDGRKQNFEVTTRAAPLVMGRPLAPQVEIQRRRDPDQRPERIELRQGTALQLGDILGGNASLGGMEFATVSDRLGDYFGVDTGVLVVRAGANNPYSLQDGDVILSIDGRAPTNAQHAGRILRSYQPGEKVKLRVQRDRKAIDLDTAAPSGRN